MSDDGTNRPEDPDATRPIDHAETVPMAPVQADAPDESPEGGGRRTALILISILAGVLLIAVIVLVVVLLTGGSDEEEPVAAPTPTATETTEPEPTESEEPEDDTEDGGDGGSTDGGGDGGSTDGGGETTPAPVFTTTAFEPEVALCDGVSSVPLRFQWMSDGAEQAWFGVGTTDAKAAPYEEVFPNEEVYEGVSFQCTEASEIYTVTLEGPGGVTSHTWEVVRG